jgi:hypothetical protein
MYIMYVLKTVYLTLHVHVCTIVHVCMYMYVCMYVCSLLDSTVVLPVVHCATTVLYTTQGRFFHFSKLLLLLLLL